MNPKSASAWVRQPSTLFFLAIVVGTAVATWCNVIPQGAAAAMLAASLPLLLNDTTSDTAANPALVAVVNALATHHEVGSAAMQVIRATAPHLLTDGTLAITKPPASAPPSRSTGLPAIACLIGTGFLLTACGSTTQVKLRQSVNDLESAYDVLAEPMPDVMAGKVPGITLTDADKALIKKASQTVYNEIATLQTAIDGGKSLTETAVSGLETDFASFQTCWTGVQAGSVSTSCTDLVPATTTTTTGN
ncbi:hypothetical protein [Komagataeibacter medellinensis]|uniref:Uncharacterized protein n=1 Tax=Komagataeibacter medellinensis (strain NBRC 3288 / BCRC 11682 / LMG 1693 / Kondo 51) TaxID=634177 RepID=G2I0S4_KOMMN|nr:hypothetical protein [Komagataeibacter medellinensis]BAK84532.1 hypothetical protein GLX_21200 [Komagataeibacter medellinensis NBRC 3288]